MDGVKCKPGDLAFKTGGTSLNKGVLFRVDYLHEEISFKYGHPCWVGVLMSSAIDSVSGECVPAGAEFCFMDKHLTPLRGDPLEESFPPLKEPLHA